MDHDGAGDTFGGPQSPPGYVGLRHGPMSYVDALQHLEARLEDLCNSSN